MKIYMWQGYYMVELACGRGRHVLHYIDKAENVILVDILDKNIGL